MWLILIVVKWLICDQWSILIVMWLKQCHVYHPWLGMVYNTYLWMTGGWCRWHCFNHITVFWLRKNIFLWLKLQFWGVIWRIPHQIWIEVSWVIACNNPSLQQYHHCWAAKMILLPDARFLGSVSSYEVGWWNMRSKLMRNDNNEPITVLKSLQKKSQIFLY